MTRRFGKWKSAIALLAAFTVVGTSIANGSPATMTEASWNDDVHVNATLTASEYVGVNYARAAASNGTMTRILTTSNFGGVVSTVNTTAAPDHIDSGDMPFSGDGILNLIYFESNARSCARVGSLLCVDDPVSPPSVPAFAVSRFNSMEVRTSRNLGPWLVRYQGGSNNPIKTTASCTPGEAGVTGISAGAGFQLRNGTFGSTTLQVPTTDGASVTGTASNSVFYDYITTLRYESETDINYARSELRMTIDAVGLLGDEPWDLDLLLSRAECGVSKPLGGGVVPASAGGMTMNAVMDEALAIDTEPGEAGTLDDAEAEAEAESDDPDADQSETTTSATATTSDKADDQHESATEGTSTSATSAVPEIAQSTVTVTSQTANTSTRTSPRATTSSPRSTPSTAPTRSSSVHATPSSTRPSGPTTTPTSAVAGAAIPDEPGDLPQSARTEVVDTITAGDEELDVVVVNTGDLPPDAAQGARTLNAWLGGGNPGTTWKTFASDDPGEDGWRWAAINQQTGTVVYIR